MNGKYIKHVAAAVLSPLAAVALLLDKFLGNVAIAHCARNIIRDYRATPSRGSLRILPTLIPIFLARLQRATREEFYRKSAIRHIFNAIFVGGKKLVFIYDLFINMKRMFVCNKHAHIDMNLYARRKCMYIYTYNFTFIIRLIYNDIK